jgi:hypothetical protein
MTFESIPRLVTSDYELTCGTGGELRLSGQLSMHDPSSVIGSFFTHAHQAALEGCVKEIAVDIRGLRFVNSSAIRLFVDWFTRIEGLPSESRYQVVFIADTSMSWQRSTLHVFSSMFQGVVRVDDRADSAVGP